VRDASQPRATRVRGGGGGAGGGGGGRGKGAAVGGEWAATPPLSRAKRGAKEPDRCAAYFRPASLLLRQRTHTSASPQPPPSSQRSRSTNLNHTTTLDRTGYTGVYRRYGRRRAGHSAEPAHPYRAEYRGRYLGTFPTKLKAAVAYACARQQQSTPGRQSRGQQSRAWQRPRQRASTVSPSYSVTGDGGTGAEASAEEEEDSDEFIDSIRIRAQEQPPMSTQYGGGEEEEQGEQVRRETRGSFLL
jgi:hypothetical protein